MKLYILHYESPELGYKIKGFANKKKAISYRAKIKKFCTNLTILFYKRHALTPTTKLKNLTRHYI